MNFKKRIANTILGEDSLFYVHSGSNVQLNEDIDFEDERETIEIKGDNIEIDGNGFRLKGHKNAIQFLIEGDDITIKNVTFENIRMRDGDGIIIHSGGKLTLNNCNFEKNYKCSPKGGIITNRDGEIIFEDCNFKKNNNPRANGGIINNQHGLVTLSGCDIRKNNARFGGAIFNKGEINIEGCNFSDNFASKGMSIFNAINADLNMGICNFIREYKTDEVTSLNNEIINMGIISIADENQKDFIKRYSHGGFMHVISKNAASFAYLKELIASSEDKISLDRDVIFRSTDEAITIRRRNLEIDGNGHVIDGFGRSNILNIISENITLKNIYFRNGSGKEGSAITNDSNSLVLENCYFENNISENGGAIKNNGKITARNCHFENNISNHKYGGAIDNNGEFILRKCLFTGNFSKEYGGAINNSKLLCIYDCEFISNLADNGACIHNTPEGEVKIDICTFNNNKAFKKGCILFNKNQAHISNVNTKNNVSAKDSNVIYQKGDENSMTKIEDSNFSRKYFNNSLIFIENGTCHIESTTFDIKKEDNESYLIYNDNAIIKFRNTDFNTSQIIYNDNITYVDKEDNIEDYIQHGESGQSLKYFTDNKELKN